MKEKGEKKEEDNEGKKTKKYISWWLLVVNIFKLLIWTNLKRDKELK